MRILDEQDNEIQESDVDFSKGHLEQDWYCIAHHPEIPSSGPITHFETLFKFDDGTSVWLKNDEYKVDPKTDTYTFNDDKLNEKNIVGMDGRQVEDQHYVELQLIEARANQRKTESEERERKNTEYNGLLSSMDDVLLVMAEGEGSTSDLENQINDINLVLADLIGE